MPAEIHPLLAAALAARENAHAPFSHFRVGAALEDDSGRIHTGCNIENATYGLTLCAERVAVFKAVSEGARKFRRIAVAADTDTLTPPCGACRQILWEFCGDVELILGNKNATLARAHENNPDVWPAIEAALNGPSLWDEVTDLLGRRGYTIEPGSADREYAAPYIERPDVRRAWLKIYQQSDTDDELYLLGEALMDVATAFSQYRWNHFIGTQRILGLKPGSGGSAGVGWLKSITEHRFFPELWTIRTQLR